MQKENNYAFIDSQNLNLGIRSSNWKLDFARFRKYLSDKYKVNVAYLFIGYVYQNHALYRSLQKAGYILMFKPTIPGENGEIKGNVDANLVLQAMIDIDDYDKAVIVSSDGDFYCLVEYLYNKNKLLKVLSPYQDTCSSLLRKAGKEKLVFMNNLKNKLEYKKIPLRDKTA